MSEIFFTADGERVMLTRDQLRGLLELATAGADTGEIMLLVFDGAPADKAWIEAVE